MAWQKPSSFGSVTEATSAPFNMGLSALMRIDNILQHITRIAGDPMIPKEIKQNLKVGLVKQLFIQASPLLKQEVVDHYYLEFAKLKPYEVIMNHSSGGMVKKTENKAIYSEELEVELDRLSLEIQREMQKEKYFMPPRSDPRVGWKME
jgi:hypothetical protein